MEALPTESEPASIRLKKVDEPTPIRMFLPPAAEITVARHSLYPDIAMGWTPAHRIPKPIPFMFDDWLAEDLPSLRGPCRLVYLGPLPASSYFLHLGRPYRFPYIDMKPMPITARRPFQGMREDDDRISFDSNFEGGNLEAAVRLSAG